MSLLFMFFFFKQKTAYEMRISDWSSDVCSSDLRFFAGAEAVALGDEGRRRRIVRRQRDGQRVVGGERAEGSAEQRVRSCREHRQAVVLALAEPLDPETEGGALGAADPLALHEEIGRASCRERVWKNV